jgi:hypothetical protein
MDVVTLIRTLWDRFAATLAVALGLLALLLGYIGVRGTAYVAEQIPYLISGGLIGIFLLGVGATLWLSADLKDQWRALLDVRRALDDGELQLVRASDLASLPAAPSTNGDRAEPEEPKEPKARARSTRAAAARTR